MLVTLEELFPKPFNNFHVGMTFKHNVMKSVYNCENKKYLFMPFFF